MLSITPLKYLIVLDEGAAATTGKTPLVRLSILSLALSIGCALAEEEGADGVTGTGAAAVRSTTTRIESLDAPSLFSLL